MKYLPDFLLPKFKPKVINDILKGEDILGRVVGINLKPFDFSDFNQLSLFIEGILKIKSEEDTIFIEGFEGMSKDILLEIEKETGLIFKTGDNTRTLNIPHIIIKAHDILEEDYNSKETLVICSDKEKLLELLHILSNHFKFLSVYGLDSDGQEELYDEIFESTGISIFQPVNIERVLKTYNIIINFNNNLDFNIENVRNDVMLIDFSKKKPFRYIGKKVVTIEDIYFKLDFENSFIDNQISPSLLEGLNEDIGRIFNQIRFKDSFYYIEEIIGTRIRLKGKF